MREPTFYRGDVPSVLDVFLLSDTMFTPNVFLKCNIERSDRSCQHQRVSLEVKIPRAKAKALYRTARNWRVFGSSAFLSDVTNVEWSTINRNASCEQQWNYFSATMLSILDAHAPMRRIRVRNPSHPPVSDDTMELMNQRRSAKLCNDPAYHDLDVQTKTAIRKDCRESISNRVRNSNPSDLFRQLRPVIATKKGKPPQPINLTPDQIYQYFTSIGVETHDEVAAEFRRSGRPPLPTRLPRANTGAMILTPITLDQLKRVVFSLPNKTSPIDDIPIKILKISFTVIDRILLRIINKSFASEIVPTSWKTAVVTSLHKRGDPSERSNFKPITQVPSICKVVEKKIVHGQLSFYLKEQHLFSEDQHGFLAKHSTCTALLAMTGYILKMYE